MLTLIEVTSLIPSRILALSRRKSSVRPRFCVFFFVVSRQQLSSVFTNVARWPWRPWGHHLQTLLGTALVAEVGSRETLRSSVRRDIRDANFGVTKLWTMDLKNLPFKNVFWMCFIGCRSILNEKANWYKVRPPLYSYSWLVVSNIFIHVLFSISYMACHPSHWRTSHIFQDG